MNDFERVALSIKERGYVVAFTGAGISVDSGIPAFRGGQGLWDRYDPMEYAHISAFMRNPQKVWNMLREMSRFIFDAKPNRAHLALSEMEKRGYLKAVITQNVDGLHQEAGNTNVIEYHGNHRWLVCLSCFDRVPLTRDMLEIFPHPDCRVCGRPLKPDVVFFGEPIPVQEMARAEREAERCKVMLIVGTSGVVYPAAEIPYRSKSKGALIVEINLSETAFTSSITDFFFKGNASEILPQILTYL